MKNLVGRITLRLSETSKSKILCIIVLPLLLLGFFLSGRGVYASSDNDFTNANVSVTASQGTVIYSGFTVTGSNDNGSVYSGYFDFYIPIGLSYYISAVPDNEYYGTIETSATLGLSRNVSQVGPYAYFGLVDYSIVDNDKNFDIWASTASYYDNTHSSGSQNYYFYYYLDGSSGFVGVKYINLILHVREYWYDSAGHGINDYTAYVPTVSVYGFSSSYSNVQYRRSERYVLGIISDKLNGLSTVNGNLTTIDNHITTDPGNTSSDISSVNSDYTTAQAAADVSVDNSVHNYNNDLATVENFDFSSFFTSQRSAATFWRDVGEYILNSSQLGFVASGVIITTLITLFVFMLRL